MPELRLLYACPNGGYRNKITASRMHAEGVAPGVPDLDLPVARGGYHGLRIELKRPAEDGHPKGVLSYDQKVWLDELNAEGYKAIVAFGWVDAAEQILEYLGE